MNKYVFVLIVCAVVFLVCFLIDSLLKLLFPKSRLEKSKQVVRPPRRSAVIGVILTFAGAAMLVKLLPEKGDLLFILGSIVAVIFGVILLCTYFSFVIYYDDEGFLYKAWGHGKQEFRYSQIRGQRSLLTRGGVNTILFVGEEEINLYSAMQNLNAFLSKAFFKWCAAKGIDPWKIIPVWRPTSQTRIPQRRRTADNKKQGAARARAAPFLFFRGAYSTVTRPSGPMVTDMPSLT